MLDPSFDSSIFFNAEEKKPRFDKRLAGALVGLALFFLAAGYVFFLSPPSDFPVGSSILIPSGWGLSQTAAYLKQEHIIRSEYSFKVFSVLFGTVKNISAGDYEFPAGESVWQIARDLGTGSHRSPASKVTIPEGMTIVQISKLFSAEDFPAFDQKEFLKLAKGKEGYLFPDTYIFSPDITAAQVIQTMSDNFAKKTADAESESVAQKKKFSDVLIMASILEEEANDDKSMKIVSGILWKRLKLGIPLQVDATLKYVTGRGTSQLTESDLAMKSPYNSYTNAGLPPAPISNPGTAAIEAALNPTSTAFLYFLTDNKGVMHYGVTLADHAANKQKYLQ